MIAFMFQTIYLGVLSIWDIKEKRVPVFPLLAGGAVLVLFAIYTCLMGDVQWRTLLGGIVPGSLLVVLACLTDQIGKADGLVVMALGAQCGLRRCLMLLFYSLFFISVFSLVLMIFFKAKSSTRIPYLPFLLVGLWIGGVR
ncbi:MAG: prepilin peptidase [Lachnospiraceae bacterium]|nr:prepilin peptidase [Lachnospiraceae bacterium]